VDDTPVLMAVGLRNLPREIGRLATLEGVDYADCVVATTSDATERTPEEWARAVMEDTPTGRSAPALWRLIGLRLGPMPSPDHVQGWRIADRGDDWIRAETAAWYMTAQAVVRVAQDQVSLALFLRFDRAVAGVIWLPVGVLHRRGVPAMLRQAVRAHRPVVAGADLAQ
jgi:hypothetical protein